MPFTIGGHKVRFRVRKANEFQFKIFLDNDQSIILRAIKNFMKVDIEHYTKESFGHSKGLLGTFDEGFMMARNGTAVFEDPNEFGQEWQVRGEDGMLFHDISGPQYPEPCAMPDPTQSQRRLGEGSLISYEAAAKACLFAEPADLEDCITDVLATGDPEMAGAFLNHLF